jgi:DNA-binding phage protein
MSYELKISPRDRAGSRLVHSVHKQLVLAALDQKAETGVSQQQIAEKLGVNRSVINRLLRGTGNLTLRTLGEVAWALGLEVVVTLRKRQSGGVNANP